MSPLTGGEPANLKGIIWGIIAGGSYACITMMNRAHMQWGYPSALITFYEQSTAAAVLFFVTLLTVRVVPTPRDLFLLFILGSVFTAFAHSLLWAEKHHCSYFRIDIVYGTCLRDHICFHPVRGKA